MIRTHTHLLFFITYIAIVSFVLSGCSLPPNINTPTAQLTPLEKIDYEVSTTKREAPALEYYYYCIDEDSLNPDIVNLIDAVSKQEQVITLNSSNEEYLVETLENFSDVINSTYYKELLTNIEYRARDGKAKITLSYDVEAVEKFSEALDKANSILEELGVQYLTDLGVTKRVYEYIILNTIYDAETLEKDSAYGALIQGRAACVGYTDSYSLLLNLCGIETRRLVSLQLEHAWNLVKIGDFWYHCDATYGDNVPHIDGFISYKYFMKNDEFMEAMEQDRVHTDIGSALGENYYFEYEGYFLYNINDVLYAYTFADNSLIRYKIIDSAIDKSTAEIIAQDIFSWCQIENETNHLICNDLYGRYTFSVSLDGKHQKYYYENSDYYLVSAQKTQDGYKVFSADDIKGEIYEQYMEFSR